MPWIRAEPIAVVGLGCRFPGAAGPEEFLALLRDGIDAVRELPSDRWNRERYHDPDPDAPGKTYVTRGGYLDDVASFDAAHFGIAPAEALRMDPQQRLLLEVSWHALEHAAIAPGSLYGTPAGVFFGISSGDFASVLRRTTPTEAVDGYVATGNAFSVAAGRVSYALGLTGPSLAVDTACSSSLVAVHLAAQSLRLRECEVALAGGVNLLLEPESTINFAKARMLAPDGCTKAFDARADGFVRGEGCGVVVLKRLADALAAGDDVWAVLRGSAVNQDGASSGLTAPNGTSQREVLRAALAGAGVEPRQVGFVEAHGTGTALGDPIELGALAAVYGAGTGRGQPLQLGTVKANIGHLESAAGVAGLIKAVLALRYGELPQQIHFETPSAHVDWANSGLEVVRERRSFDAIDERRVAAISSFGFSGTNAHVIVEAAPDFRPAETATAGPHALLLGAGDKTRVDALAQDWAETLERAPPGSVAALARTAWLGRDRGPERIAASGVDGAELATNLRAAIAGTAQPGAARARVRSGSARGQLAFLFSGQGAAWVGMGLALRDREPVFREVLERCAGVLGERAVLEPDRVAADGVVDTGDAQPALFAFEVAMTELLRSRGLEPDYVLGHSVGEIAAACVAGVLELEDAARLVRARAECMSALPAGGKMVAVVADPAKVEDAVRAAGREVSVAAINGPRQVVVSGAAAAVDALTAALGADDVRELAVSHAFHSALMDPALDALRDAAADVRFRPPRIPLVSSRTGELSGSEIGQPEHWVRQLRETVRFADAIDTLWTSGVQEFVEVGPGAALAGLARSNLTADLGVLAVPTATRRRGELTTLIDAVAALCTRRADRDLGPWLGAGPRDAAAPRSSFQRTRFWPTSPDAAAEPRAAEAVDEPRAAEAARPPLAAWGWSPSFRRLTQPATVSAPATPVVVVGDHRADAVVDALTARSVRVLQRRPTEPLELDAAGEIAPAHIVVVPPADGSTAWAATLAQTLTTNAGRQTAVVVVTTAAHEVTGAETLDPQAAAAAAIGEVLGQELLGARTRRVDLDPATADMPRPLVDELLADPGDAAVPRVVAYRGAHRWALDHVAVPLDDDRCGSRRAPASRQDSSEAVVLVGRLTGGLGERIARHLLRAGTKHLIAIGAGLGGGTDSHPAEAAALARLQDLADDGARVDGVAADVGDAGSLARAIGAIETDGASIGTVVHAGASGRPEIARLLVQEDQQSTDAMVALARERVDGMTALVEALGARRPRYVLVVTSLAAHVGGVGFADYAAVNAYAEAFVQQHARSTGAPWSTVAFEALAEELGHGVERLGEGSALRRLALSDRDFDDALGRLGLYSATPGAPGRNAGPPPGTLLIVPSDTAKRIARAHAPAVASVGNGSAAAPANGGAGPRDDVERALVEIWQDFLPTRAVGIHDDYFALGGTSLAAVQILSRLKSQFAVEVPLEALLGNEPTVAAVATTVRELQTQAMAETATSLAADDAEIEELLGLVEQLSPDEAERALEGG
ncbi:MAG: beta-ketoacyl synthase N-terminal-like domain-containing protein [Planctomycetota bacterium]